MMIKVSCPKCGHHYQPRAAEYSVHCPNCKCVIGVRMSDGTVVPRVFKVKKDGK